MTGKEPTMEEKAIIGMMRQALQIALSNCTFRWLFCWNGENPETDYAFDCACCITWDDEIKKRCKCICHKRMDELDHLFYVAIQTIRQHQNSWWWDRNICGQKNHSGISPTTSYNKDGGFSLEEGCEEENKSSPINLSGTKSSHPSTQSSH